MRVVAGRYAIRAELGRGGMGVVWRADDQVIGRQVALKELPALTNSIERVLREARTAGRLNDPAVVTVFDVISENGVTYIVMELVEAPTLADVIAAEGPLPAERVATLGLQVLGALETAHAAGIVHRDVKPSNIMVLPDDRVKLADFGIARAMDDPNLTMTGGIMGSPGYMAPELFSGSKPSPASDLWALGATLFHAVEGRSPFSRETTAATMHAIMYEDPQLTRREGPLAQLIMGLLSQSVESRLTVAGARELLKSPANADATQVVDPPTVQVHAVRRDTLPREPWQEQFPEEVPLAAPAPASWAVEDQWAPKKKPGRKRVLMLAGAGAVVVAALVAVFLLVPSAQRGEASAPSGTSTVANVAGTTAPSGTESSVAPPSVSVPSTVSAASSAPPVGTVTVTKPGPGGTAGGQAPPAGQQPGQQPQEPPKPQRVLVPLTRYNHASGPHFSATPSVPAPNGFTKENLLGNLVQAAEPGTRKLYACQIKGSEDRMTSFDASCEGNGNRLVGPLGYIFSSKPAGVSSTPLHRCTYNGGHFDSVLANCENENFEFLFGYLIA